MTRHTPSNQFNKDVDKVFNHYNKYGNEYKNIAKNISKIIMIAYMIIYKEQEKNRISH